MKGLGLAAYEVVMSQANKRGERDKKSKSVSKKGVVDFGDGESPPRQRPQPVEESNPEGKRPFN